MLVLHLDVSDPDTGGSFRVKQYSSENRDDDNGWRHERIARSPIPACSEFRTILMLPQDGRVVSVIAERVAAID